MAGDDPSNLDLKRLARSRTEQTAARRIRLRQPVPRLDRNVCHAAVDQPPEAPPAAQVVSAQTQQRHHA